MKLIHLLLLISLITAITIGLVFIIKSKEYPQNQQFSGENKLQVVATFYPLAEFARNIGRDRISLKTLVATGVEPHNFEPTTDDLISLHKANIVILNGLGLEPWITKLMQQTEYQNIIFHTVSNTITSNSDKNNPDPHVWINPVYAQQIVNSIAQTFIAADPKNTADYTQNAELYIQKLQNLDREYSDALRNCSQDKVIISHNALGYLAQQYKFKALPIVGINPEEEPSLQKLTEISQLAKSNSIKYIFYESPVPSHYSDTIAKEVGATTLVFNPIEGLTSDDIEQGKNYISIQEENINNLKIGLECQ